MAFNLDEAATLIESGNDPEALPILDDALFEDPDDPRALYLLGMIMSNSEKHGLAYNLFKRVTEEAPERHQAWLNMGKCCDELKRYQESEQHFLKSLSLKEDPLAYSNLSALQVKLCRPRMAKRWAKKALNLMPNLRSAHLNLGFSKLMLKDYSGWADYEAGLGHVKWRDVKEYGGEMWEPVHNGEVVIYGEQGIGDQIAYAEPITKAIKDADRVILDVSPKLEGLFRRSFGVETHGTQFKKNPEWAQGRCFEACALSSLQKFYRASPKGFSQKPYLVADPERRAAVRGLLSQVNPEKKPVIGISWTGGLKETGRDERSTDFETLKPLIEAVDACWVSLEYKGEKLATELILDFPWLTKTKDYDDTAALVAEMDLVISVPQSVVHLAGALGVDCWVLQSPKPHFIFGLEGETLFYGTVKQYRREKGWDIIETVKKDLERRYAL